MESMEIPARTAAQTVFSVLIVDPVVADRGYSSDLLRRRGYVVFEAAHADEALALLNSRLEIDALVTAAVIPGSMDGIALAQWVRSTRPVLHVVVLSDSDPGTGLFDEDIACVRKPLIPADFLATLPSPNIELP